VAQGHRQHVDQLGDVVGEILDGVALHEGEEGGEEGEQGLAAGVEGGGDDPQVRDELVQGVVQLLAGGGGGWREEATL
jgi:hypothetical protein